MFPWDVKKNRFVFKLPFLKSVSFNPEEFNKGKNSSRPPRGKSANSGPDEVAETERDLNPAEDEADRPEKNFLDNSTHIMGHGDIKFLNISQDEEKSPREVSN